MRWQEREELLKDWSIRCWQALSLPRLAFIHSLVWNFYLFCAFASRGPSSQSYSFSSSHVWIWETVKKAERQKICASWTVVLEKTLESPLDLKEIKPVNPNGNQSWIFIGSWNSSTLATWCKELTHLKRPWCWQRVKVGGKGDNRGWDCWMASLDSMNMNFELPPGDGNGQGILVCCSPWSRKEVDTTEQLNLTELWLLGSQFPHQGLNPGHGSESTVLTTRSPGNSLIIRV